MAYHTSQGDGFDQSTPWSEWTWDPNHRSWYVYRINAEGAQEYSYQQPDRSENQAATPRTPGLTDQSVTSDEQSTHSSPSISTNPNAYTTSQADNYNNLGRDATPKPLYASPASVHDYYKFPDSSVQNYDTASTDHPSPTWSSEYPSSGNATWQSNTDVASPSIDATARAFDDMSLATPHIPPTGAFEPGVSQAIVNAKHIFKAPNTGNAETLDPRYTVYSGFRLQDDFWKVGRVFMILWTEPAQPKVPANGGTRNGSHFSTTFLGQQAYSEIRSPIQTYSGQATLKPNLPAPRRHTIIHTTPQAPEVYSYSADDGQKISENIVLDPIQVNSERSHEPEGLLKSLSRLNYSKVYTVEHYFCVLNIGMVASNSISTFLYQSGWSQGVQPVESQRPRSNLPSRRTSSHPFSNHRNRHSNKHK
ncbi:uncharacterized protein EAF01_007971 [Botrytis porri]|uniref:uncharacterized protein n=1 Tax=Botrytis porri TaxID=87229 RepID=UPI0019018CEF|nr:uncharacterized protein EAF01_007971 [Botrytis porri]KAF7900669.1 hypothetical protein EAF01_007971 [Botrytis porri]